MPYFPIVLYPEPIREFLHSKKAEVSGIPPLPEAPILKIASLGSSANQFSHIALLQLALAVNFLLLAGAIFFTNLSTWLLLALLLSCSCTLIVALRKFAVGQFYQKSLPDRETNQKKKYKLQPLFDNKTINTHRRKLHARLAQSLVLPQGYSTAQQGASETQFKHYLDRYFPERIHQGFKLPIPESDMSYSADFTYTDRALGLCIDIEIDEPYYYKTKEPTHCCDRGKDKNRNAFFLKSNWVVIRFAEEQVVCHPNRCCKVIALVVAEITGEWELFDKFNSVPELPSVKHWTVKEARRMARMKYRDRYLN